MAVGKKKLKRYWVPFTCMALRAIHLECANSMDTTPPIFYYIYKANSM